MPRPADIDTNLGSLIYLQVVQRILNLDLVVATVVVRTGLDEIVLRIRTGEFILAEPVGFRTSGGGDDDGILLSLEGITIAFFTHYLTQV